MSQKHYAPLFKTFAWLREHDAIDSNCERVLRMVSKRYKKVMVCGNPNSGKNTVANTIFAYWHELGTEAVFTPTVNCKTPGGFTSTPSWKSYRPCFATGTPLIMPMRYEQEYYGEQCLPGLFTAAKNFDVIVDCRSLPDGTRLVSQVWLRRGKDWRCLYRSPAFASLQIGCAA